MKADVYNMKAEVIGKIDLNKEIFGIEPNEAVVHQVVKAYLANQRQGTQSTKTRSDVRGGGRKPWRQKGTGRARVGTIRSPLWKGGGVVFAPKPRDYTQHINKKMKRLALKSVFSAKYNEKELFIFDEIKFDAPKTKDMIKVLAGINATKALIVLDTNDIKVRKSASNIPGVACALVNTINVYDILKYDKLVLTKGSLKKIEEVYV